MGQTGSGEEVCLAHGQLVQTLDELLRKTYSDWSQGVDRQSIQRLEQPLMLRCRQDNTMLDINFDKWVPLPWWWWPNDQEFMDAPTLSNTYVHAFTLSAFSLRFYPKRFPTV